MIDQERDGTVTFNQEEFERQIRWMEQGTGLFEKGLGKLNQEALRQPSLLEGWSEALLIAHVISNARALLNLTVWAKTGIETPMYQSNEQRAKDIEEGAAKPLSELAHGFSSSSKDLAEAINSLTSDQLTYTVRSARGRDIPVFEIAWMRNREIWVHSVDLNVGISFSEFPLELLLALMDEVVSTFPSRKEPPALRLIANDVDKTWLTHASQGAVSATGNLSDLLAYMIGRSKGEGLSFSTPDGSAPQVPAWL